MSGLGSGRGLDEMTSASPLLVILLILGCLAAVPKLALHCKVGSPALCTGFLAFEVG